MSGRESGDHTDERKHATEGRHETQKKQQMVGALENVEKPRPQEAQGRVVPRRIQPQDSRVAGELEGAHRAVRRHETHDRHYRGAQPRKIRLDAEP